MIIFGSVVVNYSKESDGEVNSVILRKYFYGVKVQALVNADGIPVELGFVPGCEGDVQALKKLSLAVAAESKIYGDSAYTDYQVEDDMREAELIELMTQRKSNSR